VAPAVRSRVGLAAAVVAGVGIRIGSVVGVERMGRMGVVVAVVARVVGVVVGVRRTGVGSRVAVAVVVVVVAEGAGKEGSRSLVEHRRKIDGCRWGSRSVLSIAPGERSFAVYQQGLGQATGCRRHLLGGRPAVLAFVADAVRRAVP
jgi:hypothetical protein